MIVYKGKTMKTLIKSTAITLALTMTTLYSGADHSGHGHNHSEKEASKSKIKLNAKKDFQL